MDDEYIRDGKVYYVLIHHTSGDDSMYASILTRTVFDPEPPETHTQIRDSWHSNIRDAQARCDTLNNELASQSKAEE